MRTLYHVRGETREGRDNPLRWESVWRPFTWTTEQTREAADTEAYKQNAMSWPHLHARGFHVEEETRS